MAVRKALRIVLVVILVMLLMPSITQAKRVQITYRHWGHNEGFKGVWDLFNASQNEIEVIYEYEPDYFVYNAKLLTEIAAGKGPDMFSLQGWPDAEVSIYKWMKSGALLDLTPFFTRDKKQLNADAWYQFVIDACSVEGKLAGLPYYWSFMSALEYNADIFDESGVPYPDDTWTWYTMADVAKKLTRIDGSGATVRWGIDPGTFRWFVIEPMIVSAGGSLFNEKQTELALNSGPALRVLEWIAGLRDRGILRSGPGWWDRGGIGNIAMRIAPVHHATADKVQFKVPFEPGLAVVPMDPLTKRRASLIEIGLTGVNVNTKNPAACWEALKFFTKNYAQGSLKTWGYVQMVPVAQEAVPLFLAQDPKVIGKQLAKDLPHVLAATAKFAYVNPPVVNPLSVELRSEIFSILNREWAKVLSGEIPVGQFIENASAPINALLQGRSSKSGQ